MIRLREKDIEKLSAITGVSVYDIEKLSAVGVIDHSGAVDLLIASDWKRLKGRYTTWQLTKAMMEEYSGYIR